MVVPVTVSLIVRLATWKGTLLTKCVYTVIPRLFAGVCCCSPFACELLTQINEVDLMG